MPVAAQQLTHGCPRSYSGQALILFDREHGSKYMPAYIRIQWESTTDFRFQARTEDDVALARLVYQKQVELVGIGPPRSTRRRGGSRRSSGAAPTTEALHRKAPVVRVVQ